jgi:hypothetical protein
MGPWLEIKNLVLFYILHMYHILFDSPEQVILHIEVLLILFIFSCLYNINTQIKNYIQHMDQSSVIYKLVHYNFTVRVSCMYILQTQTF